MEAVVDNVGVTENLGGNEHHRRRQIARHLLHPASDRFPHGSDEDRDYPVALCAGDGRRQRPMATVTVLVGQESPYLAIAQTGLVKAHVRPDVVSVEVEAAAEFGLAPSGITAQLIAVQFGKIFAVYAVHLRYVSNRQSRRLHLRLLKKPRTRH